MQPPEVQFTTTSDGVTIAYRAIGEGPPLVITQNLVLSHAEHEWTVPSLRQLALGKGFTLEAAGETVPRGFDEPLRLWKVTGF